MVMADEIQGYWLYDVNSDGTVTITGYSGLESNVTIPSKLGGKTVTKIGGAYDAPFRNNDSIVNVTLHSNIKEIGGNAFNDCDSLTKVLGGSGLIKIGHSAELMYKKSISNTVPFFPGDICINVSFLYRTSKHSFRLSAIKPS